VRDRPVPVDDGIATLAQRVLFGVVLLPTAAALVLGVAARLIGALTGAGDGESLSGLLTCLLLIGVLQAPVLAVGLMHYLSGVKLHGEAPATPAKAEPGIFHHE
jgi:hypothetical protein